MADIRSRRMSAKDLWPELQKLDCGSPSYLIQRLYGSISFDLLRPDLVDLTNCMDGRAFGASGEVTWQLLEGDSFRVCAVWDEGEMPGALAFADEHRLPACTELNPHFSGIFLWGTRMGASVPPRWFAQQVASAKLYYPIGVGATVDQSYRVKTSIVRYTDPATGELVAWRMKGLELVHRMNVTNQEEGK